jgi:2-polyprenyl-6-hydroxyphenyl methylase/3-demethylubiquinone-9 3-methyltransferase
VTEDHVSEDSVPNHNLPAYNVDPAETDKFDDLARQWWDTEGDFKPLHRINPLRLGYIVQRATLAGARVLDIGCGGGILAESMAARGANVTGQDAAPKPIAVARLHAIDAGIDVNYVHTPLEELARETAQPYDVITCLETLEHVPDPGKMITLISSILRPGGDLFLSTINRNPKAYALAVIGAEYVLRMLPKGTHDYAKFIRPSEMSRWLRSAGLSVSDLTGMTYNPLTDVYRLSPDTDVNYLVHAVKPG